MGDVPALTNPFDATKYKLTDILTEMNKRSGHNYLFNIDVTTDARNQPVFIFSPADLIIQKPESYNDPTMTKKVNALKVCLLMFT